MHLSEWLVYQECDMLAESNSSAECAYIYTYTYWWVYYIYITQSLVNNLEGLQEQVQDLIPLVWWMIDDCVFLRNSKKW